MDKNLAIERVRSRFDKWALDEEDLEALRALGLVTIESEDERIRKELIDFVNHYRHNTDLTAEQAEWCKKVIAYLEKQKEQKSIDIAVKEVTKDKESAMKFLKSAGIVDENGELSEIYRSEKNSEEWSEEDEEKIDDIIGIICDARECSKIANIGEEREDNSDFYNNLVLFLKSLRPQAHWKPTEEQPEYIDLGLSVKWASCNVGASKPEDYGNYYAYDEENNIEGIKAPTKEQWEELIEKCKWEWKDRGYEVTGPNGNSIFLPTAGRPLRLAGGGPDSALYVYFNSDYVSRYNSSHRDGHSVRPVSE